MDAQILFGTGFSNALSLLDTAMEKGIVVANGRNYLFDGEKVASGMPKLRDWAKENAELLKERLETI